MEEQFDYDEEEELRRKRRKQRIAEMKREKERRERLQRNIKRYALCGGGVLFAMVILWTGIRLSRKDSEEKPGGLGDVEISENVARTKDAEMAENIGATEEAETSGHGNGGETTENVVAIKTGKSETSSIETTVQDDDVPTGAVPFQGGYSAKTTPSTINVGDTDVLSSYAILVDLSSDTIVAQKEAKTVINPASMTKILTVLVAAEHITNLDDTFTMTLDITDYAYVNDCSSVGFLDGETVPVRDLFYGTVLPSGGDAAVALATYVAGSQEAFVELMNAKLEELGLSETAHFTNCVGIYDKEHYCTVYDMAMILKAAVENDWCREVLSAHTYTTAATVEHPEGITISNWFLRRIEDKDTGGEVICAKTGFVNQSGSCAASYAISDEGTPYICVTAQTYSSWRCIYDHVALYSLYAE